LLKSKSNQSNAVYLCAQSVLREEIRRIKARDPNITHKQAFSAASKNVRIVSMTMTAKLQTVSASPISALYYIHYSSKFLHNFLANYHMVVASMQWAHLPRIEHKEN
jgi:hypothetical protein